MASKKIGKARAMLEAHGLSLPEAWLDHPWGEKALKVKKKVFVFLGPEDAKELRFSVKLPASCTEALARDDAEPTGYGLGRSGWVSFAISASNLPKDDVLIDWLEESYQAVAPKKLAKLLEPE
ncbi:MAG: MmcQ/YjbR family DNA-binding protein [Myxococcota bacterium]